MKLSTLVVGLLISIGLVSVASAVPSYSVTMLGLSDPEHIDANGVLLSEARYANETGHVTGYSTRFNGTIANYGQSAWLYDGSSTVQIGLTDAEHTRFDTYKESTVDDLNEAGDVLGHSKRFVSGIGNPGESACVFNGATTVRLGFVDSEHSGFFGHRSSFGAELNEAGQVRGTSVRYNGGAPPLGSSAWLYDGTSTMNIGLVGSEHTRSDDYKSSNTQDLNEAGQVTGHSDRYNGSSVSLGQTAWLFDGSSTIDIGLVGGEHTRDDGYKFSSTLGNLNEAGQVRGYSQRFDGASDLGQSAWFYDGSTTRDVGLVDSEHTRGDGYKRSFHDIFPMGSSGQLVGVSARYNNSIAGLGQSAWFFDGTTTSNIGLTDSEHTGADNFRYSAPVSMNQSGKVLGQSERYNGGSALMGTSVWLYAGGATVKIGLVGVEHTRDDGFQVNWGYALNEAGQVSGVAERFNGGSFDPFENLGYSAWFYNGMTTSEIGLVDGEHTRNDGYQENNVEGMNEAGEVIGTALRFAGGIEDLGASAWFFDGTSTTKIGLTDSAHTRSDGYQASSFEVGANGYGLPESGRVAGSSLRFNGGSTELGQDAWLYDPESDQTFAMNLSTRSDGFAFSAVTHLGEDGLVLGTYQLFDAADNDLGNRLFYFTVDDGLHDLGSLVQGGLTTHGWEALASALRVNGLGQIIGNGRLTTPTSRTAAFLLTRVPEPGAGMLVIWACVVGVSRRRRRSC